MIIVVVYLWVSWHDLLHAQSTLPINTIISRNLWKQVKSKCFPWKQLNKLPIYSQSPLLIDNFHIFRKNSWDGDLFAMTLYTFTREWGNLIPLLSTHFGINIPGHYDAVFLPCLEFGILNLYFQINLAQVTLLIINHFQLDFSNYYQYSNKLCYINSFMLQTCISNSLN